MTIFKRCSRCNNRLESGTTCSCYKKRHKEYNKYRTDTTEQKFYSSEDWEVTRAKAKHRYKDVDIYSYYVLGELEEGRTVHHIETIKENWSRRLDISNLIYLTESNHQRIHKLMNKSTEDKKAIQELLFQLVDRYQKEILIDSEGEGVV